MSESEPAEGGTTEPGRSARAHAARATQRKRGRNIEGPKVRLPGPTVSAADAARLEADAASVGMTVPRYLVSCALHPTASLNRTCGALDDAVGSAVTALPWPVRERIASTLLEAVRELASVRTTHLSKIGSNINQIARGVNVDVARGVGAVDPEVAEDLELHLARLGAVMDLVDVHVARVKDLAEQVAAR